MSIYAIHNACLLLVTLLMGLVDNWMVVSDSRFGATYD